MADKENVDAQLLASPMGGQALRLTLLPNSSAACVTHTGRLERRCVRRAETGAGSKGAQLQSAARPRTHAS